MRPLVARRPEADPRVMDRPDPAPSRWAWRLDRWLLTPGVRITLRMGLPCLALSLGGLHYFSDEARRSAVLDKLSELRSTIETRPEFMVTVMRVTGASDTVSAEIRDITPVELPASSFDIDLEHLRETIAALDAVKSASVRIRPGGVLDVSVTERVPAMVWRGYDHVTLVDETGAHIARLDTRLARPDLPLIAGEGADAHVPEALELVAVASTFGDRLRGFVRIGARRWDVVLDRGQRIMLPETGARRALERAIALDAAQDLLARDLVQVDFRLDDRPTVRVSEQATTAWRLIRAQDRARTHNQGRVQHR